MPGIMRVPFCAIKPLSIQRLAGVDSTAQKGSFLSGATMTIVEIQAVRSVRNDILPSPPSATNESDQKTGNDATSKP